MFEVIKGKSMNSNSCSVRADGKTTKFTDFITVGMSAGQATMMANADPITIAIAIEMLKEQFDIQIAGCTASERTKIMEVLQ